MWPVCTMILFPLFAAAIAQEKHSKLYLMMQLGSIRQESYFIGNYFFHVVAAIVVGVIYVAFGYISGSSQFMDASPVLFAAVVLSWAHAQSGFAMLLGSVLNSSLAVTVISVCLIIVSAVAVVVVASVVDVWPRELDWVPFVAYARSAALVQSFGGSKVYGGSELQITLLSTFVEGTAALLLAPYFHAVLPGPEQSGTPAHPLYFLKWCGIQPPVSLWCECCGSLCPCFGGRQARAGREDENVALRQANPLSGLDVSQSHSALDDDRSEPLFQSSQGASGAHSAGQSATRGRPESGAGGTVGNPRCDIDVSRETVRAMGRDAAPMDDVQRVR